MKLAHIPTFRKAAKELGLTVKTIKNGGDTNYSLLISDGKKAYLLSHKHTGFYPETRRSFAVLANSKIISQQVLDFFGYKTIKSLFIDTIHTKSQSELNDKLKKIKKFPTLIKPETGFKGRGIVIAKNQKELVTLSKSLFQKKVNFMVQEIVYGTEHRILMVCGKVYVLHAKEFPFVLGDGKTTLKKLLNNVPSKDISKNFLDSFLSKNKLKLSDVIKKDFKVPYNITRKGSYSYFESKNIPKAIINWTKGLANKLDTETIGIDVFLPDDKTETEKYKIIEINASPGFTYIAKRYKDKELVEKIAHDVLVKYFRLEKKHR